MAPSADIPLTVLPLGQQRYSCHGCGDCCRDFTVQLRPADLAQLAEQRWEERLGERVTVEFRGQTYLRQRPDGACVFLQPDGKCRIHAEHGLAAKPLACQMFPWVLAPQEDRVQVGISFACQSVLGNQGAGMTSHLADLRRMAELVPELVPTRVLLVRGMQADPKEVAAVTRALDRWLSAEGVPLAVRLDGLAWLAQQLGRADFTKVRGDRLRELLDLLVTALPDELPLHPVEPATTAQCATLRQAAFFRLEDPKIGSMRATGRLRGVLGQYLRSRAFSKGRGALPAMGARWSDGATFAAVAAVPHALECPDLPALDELFTRWLRATVLGSRAWGSGYYGWPMVQGMQALALNAACALWLARAHAAARTAAAPSGVAPSAAAALDDRAAVVTLADLRAALGRVDRACGRAPWLGSRPEALRLRYLAMDDGLRRILRA